MGSIRGAVVLASTVMKCFIEKRVMRFQIKFMLLFEPNHIRCCRYNIKQKSDLAMYF